MKFVRYEEFIKTHNALSFDMASKIYEAIISALPDNDPELSEMLEVLINLAIDYTQIRARWLFMSAPIIARMDATRSQNHDLFIDSINKVSIYMCKKGYGSAWADLLGEDRKRLGDFACYIAYIQSINAR